MVHQVKSIVIVLLNGPPKKPWIEGRCGGLPGKVQHGEVSWAWQGNHRRQNPLRGTWTVIRRDLSPLANGMTVLSNAWCTGSPRIEWSKRYHLVRGKRSFQKGIVLRNHCSIGALALANSPYQKVSSVHSMKLTCYRNTIPKVGSVKALQEYTHWQWMNIEEDWCCSGIRAKI